MVDPSPRIDTGRFSTMLRNVSDFWVEICRLGVCFKLLSISAQPLGVMGLLSVCSRGDWQCCAFLTSHFQHLDLLLSWLPSCIIY